MGTWRYRQNQELPSFAVSWSDRDGNLIDFSTGYTFTVKLVSSATGDVALTKTAGIVGDDAAPNVVVAWAPGELNVTAGSYQVHITATTGGADRLFMPGREPVIIIDPAV